MAANNDEIFEELCKLLAPFNTDNIELKPETDISSDLNIDSVSVMDFVMEVEDKYDIDIPPQCSFRNPHDERPHRRRSGSHFQGLRIWTCLPSMRISLSATSA